MIAVMHSSRYALAMSSRQLMRLALLLLVFAAVAVQQWASHTHWHAAATPISLAAHGGDTEGPAHPGHDCLWCQSAAHGGATAPPAAWPGLIAADTHAVIRPAAGFTLDFLPPPAWAWNSRGPPAA
jgi:hypothetical protein